MFADQKFRQNGVESGEVALLCRVRRGLFFFVCCLTLFLLPRDIIYIDGKKHFLPTKNLDRMAWCSGSSRVGYTEDDRGLFFFVVLLFDAKAFS